MINRVRKEISSEMRKSSI